MELSSYKGESGEKMDEFFHDYVIKQYREQFLSNSGPMTKIDINCENSLWDSLEDLDSNDINRVKSYLLKLCESIHIGLSNEKNIDRFLEYLPTFLERNDFSILYKYIDILSIIIVSIPTELIPNSYYEVAFPKLELILRNKFEDNCQIICSTLGFISTFLSSHIEFTDSFIQSGFFDDIIQLEEATKFIAGYRDDTFFTGRKEYYYNALSTREYTLLAFQSFFHTNEQYFTDDQIRELLEITIENSIMTNCNNTKILFHALLFLNNICNHYPNFVRCLIDYSRFSYRLCEIMCLEHTDSAEIAFGIVYNMIMIDSTSIPLRSLCKSLQPFLIKSLSSKLQRYTPKAIELISIYVNQCENIEIIKETGVLSMIIDLMSVVSFKIQRSASLAICSVFNSVLPGSFQLDLIMSYCIIDPLITLLDTDDVELEYQIIRTLIIILSFCVEQNNNIILNSLRLKIQHDDLQQILDDCDESLVEPINELIEILFGKEFETS